MNSDNLFENKSFYSDKEVSKQLQSKDNTIFALQQELSKSKQKNIYLLKKIKDSNHSNQNNIKINDPQLFQKEVSRDNY